MVAGPLPRGPVSPQGGNYNHPVPNILAVADETSPSLERALTAGKLDVELVLSCGDLPYDYLEFLVDALDVPLLYVHGNHDRPVHAEHRVIEAPQGCVDIEGRVMRAKGLLVAGLGGSPRYLAGARHQYTEREMAWRIRWMGPKLRWHQIRTARPLDILLTHAPPRGIHDGEDPAHQGYSVFLRFLVRYRPRYLLHGHAPPRPGLPSHTRYRDTDVIHVRGHRILEIPDAPT